MTAGSTIRKLDFRGRIVVPKEIRDRLGVGKGDSIEVSQGKKGITIKKYAATSAEKS